MSVVKRLSCDQVCGTLDPYAPCSKEGDIGQHVSVGTAGLGRSEDILRAQRSRTPNRLSRARQGLSGGIGRRQVPQEASSFRAPL
jgi:hypothetical protein